MTTQWKYLIQVLYGNPQIQLDELGAKGWELVSIIPGSYHSHWDGDWQGLTIEGAQAVFKQPHTCETTER